MQDRHRGRALPCRCHRRRLRHSMQKARRFPPRLLGDGKDSGMELAWASKLSLEDEQSREARRMQSLESSARGKAGARATPPEAELPLSKLGEASGSEASSDPFFPGTCNQARTHNFQDESRPRPGEPSAPAGEEAGAPGTWLPSPKAAPNAAAAATLTSDPKLAGKGPRGRSSRGARGKYSPEEVVFAVELAFPGEALLGQVAFTFTALDALDVPGPVQHVQEEAVQDGPFAAGTVHHGLWFGRVRPGERSAGRAEGMIHQDDRQELPSPSKMGRHTWQCKPKPAPENQREGGG